MAQQKRYKLLIWFYLHNHLHKSIHAAHSMEVELTRKTPVMVAVQPSWPFEHSITGVINAQNGTVYLASRQEGYLPIEAKEAFEENGIPF